jgi:hypothetical protein
MAATPQAGHFGGFSSAGRLATGLSAARDGYASTARSVHIHHSGLGTRTDATADQARDLDRDTATIAQQSTPGSISAAMEG